MADANMQDFDDRMRRIVRQHEALAKGYVTSVTADGLIVMRPKRRLRFPWRGALFALVVVMAFKGFLHAYLGAANYGAHVATLQAGNAAERIGAYIMSADPVTLWISSLFINFLQ